MVPLPPDLSRLGDELQAAATRAAAERRVRRRRVARALTSAVAGLMSLVVLAPATLSPDARSGSFLAREATDTLVVSEPEHQSIGLARYMAARRGVAAPAPAPPPFPSLTVRRDA